MPDIDTVIEDDRWQTLALAELAELAIPAALSAAKAMPQAHGYDVVVLGCSDARIAELNADFRDKPQATNVLSWPARDLAPGPDGTPPPLPAAEPMHDSLGDIAIAFETCEREARENGVTTRDHVLHLLVHGCLHLLGFDHMDEQQAAVMETLEVEALASIGVNNPY